MRVFNLTQNPVDFHGKLIPPDGGSLDFPDLDKFIPNADKRLEKDGMIALGYLPASWEMRNRTPPLPQPAAPTLKVEEPVVEPPRPAREYVETRPTAKRLR